MKTAITIVLIGLVVGGVIFLASRGGANNSTAVPTQSISRDANNVTMEDGKQIIEIGVRGGYNPKVSLAKAGIPTLIRFKTSNSFDCSSFIRIPSLNISQALPQTGSTDIDIGTQNVGSLLGTCGMGMYRFQINFEG